MDKAIMDKNSKLFEQLVPSMGAADTTAGELLRAVNRIVYRFWNDGDMVCVDYGNETCNPAARYILSVIDEDSDVYRVTEKIWVAQGMPDEEYEKALEELLKVTLDYIENHPGMKSEKNSDSYEKYVEEEDHWWDRDYWREEEEEESWEPFAVYDPEPRW